ncbi:MAG: hypothetical protein GVY15_07770 [Bacteroidetes bacterium]|jgi:hypothetical protein|nr:hypothetical protein [Bacteroidota bacterium]
MKTVGSVFLVVLFVFSAACSSVVNRTVDRTVDRAAERTGEVVGERIGDAAGAMIVARFPDAWTAQWTTLYTGYLFNVAFQGGTYAVAEDAYAPGEYTRWQMVSDGEPTGAYVERAFLDRTEEGNEWWHITYENEDGEAIVLEGLFSPDREELVRLRGKFPGEEAKEMPVEEGTYGYSRPRALSPESIEGATVGTAAVAVPAGTFTAQHVRYGTPGATLEWWMDEGVPGSLVKYLRRADDGSGDDDTRATPASWVAELVAYGDDATSELGVL